MEKTHYKKLRNVNYIGSYELMTGGEPKDLIVQISKATKELIQNGDKKEEAMILHLVNQKPMIINSTNAKSIEKALGTPYIEDWVGRKITLTVKKIKAFGGWHDALRVLDVEPKNTVTKEDLNPHHEKWNGAIQALIDGKVTVESITAKYSVNDENLILLQNAGK